MATLGDLDKDGISDLAVGAEQGFLGLDVGNADRGAVWILFLKNDGTVKRHQKISSTQGGFSGMLQDSVFCRGSVADPGDIDNDPETATALEFGAEVHDDGGSYRVAVWGWFLTTYSPVKLHPQFMRNHGGISLPSHNTIYFSYSSTLRR